MADAIDSIRKSAWMGGSEPDRPSSLEMHRENFAFDGDLSAFEYDARTRFQLLAGVNEAIPEFAIRIREESGIRRLAVQQQTLHDAATGNPTTQKSRGKDARIVENQQIARDEIAVEVGERDMFDRAAAVKHQEPRSATFRRRMLRNQRLGQFEIKIRNVHRHL